ncbi:uncharacterized protein LOC119981669 isoform X2 [Tripterygium wilfordii]|uniref:uncharacterized protein LOC119981669 isoform X2 n=1 Tax=Tripterygium wilfordii TaxID=458696 RepID=UPI0018F81F66|nr:uncharacterized protein LOC119981669 isoform X2 [Tripterygium wilfordii]
MVSLAHESFIQIEITEIWTLSLFPNPSLVLRDCATLYCPSKTHFVNPILWPRNSTRLSSKMPYLLVIRVTRKSLSFSMKTVSMKTWMATSTTSLSNMTMLGHQAIPVSLSLLGCQSWTITLTRVLVIACNWLILQSVVVTTYNDLMHTDMCMVVHLSVLLSLRHDC